MEQDGRRKKKKTGLKRCVCVGGFICIQTAILLILLVELYGDPLFLTCLFFAPVFFSFSFLYHFSTTSVCLWLVHPCSSHVTRTGGILCLYWPRLETRKDPVLFFLFSFWENNKKRGPEKKLKGKKKKKTSWLKEQLQTRGPTEQQSTHTGSRMARVFCWVS